MPCYRQETLEALRELAREGKVVRLRKNQYAMPGGQNIIVGRVQGHQDGFGFLIPEERGKEDVYLNRREIQAMILRINDLLESGSFPHPLENRYSYPWPPV